MLKHYIFSGTQVHLNKWRNSICDGSQIHLGMSKEILFCWCTNYEWKNNIHTGTQIMSEEIIFTLVHKFLSMSEEIQYAQVYKYTWVWVKNFYSRKYTNTLQHEWRNTIRAGYKYTWAWVKKYNLRWSGRRESGREWRASGRSATRGQTPALHSHHIVIITVLSSNCNHDSFLNHNGFVVISYSSRFFLIIL